MHTGTICDIDPQRGFGLIDADDGHIVCFNRDNVQPKIADLQVGMRVAFVADRYLENGRITAVSLWSACYGEN